MSETIESDAEKMVRVREQLRDAAAELQRLKDKQAGVTRMKRSDFDALTDAQRRLLEPAITVGTVILLDSIHDEEEKWAN